MKFKVKEYLEKLLVRFFKIGHVSIYIENKKFFVYTRVIKNGRVIEDEHRIFDVEGENESPKVMKEFFKHYYDMVKYAYVSTYIDSINQGAIHGCSETVFHELGLDLSSIVKLCVKDKWSVYTNIYEINKLQEKYKAIFGVDFIFPMEIMLEHLKSKDKTQNAVLYIMNNRNASTLTVYKNNELVYSSHFLFNDNDDSLIVANEDEEELGDSDENLLADDNDDTLDNLDLEDDALDDLDSMDDLDNIDDLDDFVVDEDDEDSLESMDDEDDNVLQSEQDLKKELLLFEFVNNSLNDYYKNPNYNSDFITEAFIYDTCKCSVGLKKHIKEAFFIEPKVLTIDLGEILCDLSQLEVDGE